MAWGLWNKIKNGYKKVGKALQGAAKFVTDKVIKPFKPIISAAATAVSPKFGAAFNTGMNVVEKFSDEGWGSAKDWAKNRFRTGD